MQRTIGRLLISLAVLATALIPILVAGLGLYLDYRGRTTAKRTTKPAM